MSEETKIYKLVEGDGSGDGHGDSTYYYVKCNMNPAELYKKAVKIAGYDLIKDYCSDYEENTIPIKILLDIWPDFFTEEYVPDEYDEPGMYKLWYGDEYWPELFMKFCQKADENFTYEFVVSEIPTIRIGGYGLYND